jgi:hypothetical protein
LRRVHASLQHANRHRGAHSLPLSTPEHLAWRKVQKSRQQASLRDAGYSPPPGPVIPTNRSSTTERAPAAQVSGLEYAKSSLRRGQFRAQIGSYGLFSAAHCAEGGGCEIQEGAY